MQSQQEGQQIWQHTGGFYGVRLALTKVLLDRGSSSLRSQCLGGLLLSEWHAAVSLVPILSMWLTNGAETSTRVSNAPTVRSMQSNMAGPQYPVFQAPEVAEMT
jgi:hypothetical protein